MKIINNNTNYIIIKNSIKLNKQIYFKNIKLVFEKFEIKYKNLWILICHAFTSSHHFLGIYKKNLKNIGWWNNVINKNFFIKNFKLLCINNIVSNFGSSGHSSVNPFINKNYHKFPQFNLIIWVKLQKILLKQISIRNIFIVIGGSLGGMQSLIWSILYPKIIKYSICIASTHKMYIENKIYNEISKLSINYNNNVFPSKFYKYNIKNIKGLKLSRFIGHLNYLSKYDLKSKLRRFYFDLNYKIINKNQKLTNYFYFKINKFYKQFNINSYLFIIKLINKFNLNFIKLDNNFKINIFFIFYKKDKRFNYKNSLLIINKLLKYNFNINFKLINIKLGHDAFLLTNKIYINILKLFIINYLQSER